MRWRVCVSAPNPLAFGASLELRGAASTFDGFVLEACRRTSGFDPLPAFMVRRNGRSRATRRRSRSIFEPDGVAGDPPLDALSHDFVVHKTSIAGAVAFQ
jgi:hypothetical protein